MLNRIILAKNIQPVDIESVREYCLCKPGVAESFPFGEGTLVFKVNGKMFALLSLDGEYQVNLKCDPDLAASLREHFDFVLPGYHMNKAHWNTILLDGRVKPEQLKNWIDHSYELVDKVQNKNR
jgi:predicted DNA-binding protein (MmcQ/YjbR family)